MGSGDFDNDGYGDLLWRNKFSNDVTLWLLRGTMIKRIPSTVLGQAPLRPDGTPAPAIIADIDRDGTCDVIWTINKQATDKLGVPINELTYQRWRVDGVPATPTAAIRDKIGLSWVVQSGDDLLAKRYVNKTQLPSSRFYSRLVLGDVAIDVDKDEGLLSWSPPR